MKIFRAIAAVAFFAAISAGSAFPQPRTNTPSPTPAPAQTGSVPDTKIALIDSSQFADEKQGIYRFVAAIKKVDAEFQPRRTELQTMQQQLEKLTADLNKAASLQDPKVTAQQNDKIEQMKKDYQRKGEDAQAAFDKKLQEVLGQTYETTAKLLVVNPKPHAITLLFVVTKFKAM